MNNTAKPLCVVTGGAGFIGSHLVDRLVAEGNRVRVLDNMYTGRVSNLDKAIETGNVEVCEVDIANYNDIAPLFEGGRWVFHLAAMADIVPSIREPMLYHRANVEGTINVLEASRNVGVEKFIYTASSSCYGIPDKYPTPESSEIDPMYPYALTKYVGEEYAMHWAKTYDMPIISLRLFNVFGPRHRTTGAYGAVFGVFLAQKLAGKPYTIVGDGEQTRDFTFVTDIVDAFITAANSDAKGKIFNVGSGNTYSVNHLVNLLGGEKTYIPKRPGEPDSTFADISFIRDELNWEPSVSFEDGVKVMLTEIDGWADAPVWTPDAIAEATEDWFKYLSNDKLK